jgi:hypothetical protein
MLERLTDRLGTLWAESDNPMAEMRSAASRLLEAELSDQQPSPRQNPREFARALLEDNPQMRSNLSQISHEIRNPEAIETADELISLLLPASHE